MPIDIVKAHAYGNDFLFAPIDQTIEDQRSGLARCVCHRYTGIGADGLVLYAPTAAGADMTLFNADQTFLWQKINWDGAQQFNWKKALIKLFLTLLTY